MREATVEIANNGMAHADAPTKVEPPPTIEQQLATQLGAIHAALGVKRTDALSGIADDIERTLAAHADLEAKQAPIIRQAGRDLPNAADALADIREQLRKSELTMRGLIDFAKVYLADHATEVADSHAQEIAAASSAVVLRASRAIELATERDRLEAAYLANLQQTAELGAGRWLDGSKVLADRFGKHHHQLMDVLLTAAPRLRGFNPETEQTFGRFVARAIRIMGDAPELRHAVRDARLAYCAGPRDWAAIAVDHAEQIAEQFGPKK